MFGGCENLVTIYASSGFVVSSGADTESMFHQCTNLRGGNGTTYSIYDGTYARIDRAGTPGYFTAKAANGRSASESLTAVSVIPPLLIVNADIDETDTLEDEAIVIENPSPEERDGSEEDQSEGFDVDDETLKDTAGKLGVDARTIRRQVQLAKNMTQEAKEIVEAADSKISQRNLLKLSQIEPEQQKEAATLLTTGQIRSVDEYRAGKVPPPSPSQKEKDKIQETQSRQEKPPPPPAAPRGTNHFDFAAVVADLKNHDKDCSATPDSFMAQYASFTIRFTKDICWYGEEYFQPVFPQLTDKQMETLRALTDRVSAAAEKIYAQIENTRRDAINHETESNE